MARITSMARSFTKHTLLVISIEFILGLVMLFLLLILLSDAIMDRNGSLPNTTVALPIITLDTHTLRNKPVYGHAADFYILNYLSVCTGMYNTHGSGRNASTITCSSQAGAPGYDYSIGRVVSDSLDFDVLNRPGMYWGPFFNTRVQMRPQTRLLVAGIVFIGTAIVLQLGILVDARSRGKVFGMLSHFVCVAVVVANLLVTVSAAMITANVARFVHTVNLHYGDFEGQTLPIVAWTGKKLLAFEWVSVALLWAACGLVIWMEVGRVRAKRAAKGNVRDADK